MLAGVWQSLKVRRAASVAMPQVADVQEPVAIYGSGFGSALLKYNRAAELIVVAGERLLLALPVEKRRGHDRALATDITPSTLPQVSGPMAQEAVLAFLNHQTRPFRFTNLPEDSLFFSALKSHAGQFRHVRRWQRAALRVAGTYDTWLEESFDARRRKEWKRQRNRLSDQGALELVRNVDPEAYLNVETRGWKGRAGTALKDSATAAAQFREICRNLEAEHALRFWTLKLDGRAIASLVGIVEGEQAWIFKIAFDEDYAKYSPGVMVLLEATRDFFADGRVKLVDSCAIPGHPMIDRLWKDRVAYADVLVAPETVPSLHFEAIYAGIAAISWIRMKLKPVYLKLRGRKLS